MDFSDALRALKSGAKVANRSWNGKGMFLELQRPDRHSKMTEPYIYLNFPADHPKYPGGKVPWLASQLDLLSEEWGVV